MRLFFCALVSTILVASACDRHQQTSTITSGAAGGAPATAPKVDPIEIQLAGLIKAHSAVTFPDVGIAADGARKTLDYQEIMDKLRGKSVGFVALLDDVYRTKEGYRAVFGPFEMGFDAIFVLDAGEEDARHLSELAHEDEFAMYVVIAQIESLRVNYEPARYVKGREGDDPDSMDVEEFGLQISRLITGKLIAFERERELTQ